MLSIENWLEFFILDSDRDSRPSIASQKAPVPVSQSSDFRDIMLVECTRY